MKIYLKDQTEKLAKYLGVDKNLQRGFFVEELSPTNQLALSDFEKAVEFIFETGISPEITGNRDEKKRHQEIAQEIVSKAIGLEVKDYNQDNQALSNTQIAQANQGTIQGITQTSTPTSTPSSTLTPAQMMEMMSQRFAGQLASELSEFKKQQEEETKNIIEELKQQHQRQIDELEQRLQTQQEEGKKYQDQILKLLQEIKEIQTNQDKLKKLAEIADIAYDLEITIGQGSQAKTMKLGDLMKDQKNKTNNLEQNLGTILSQIQLQFETQGQRLDQIEEARPLSRIREAKSNCCFPPIEKCVVM